MFFAANPFAAALAANLINRRFRPARSMPSGPRKPAMRVSMSRTDVELISKAQQRRERRLAKQAEIAKRNGWVHGQADDRAA